MKMVAGTDGKTLERRREAVERDQEGVRLPVVDILILNFLEIINENNRCFQYFII